MDLHTLLALHEVPESAIPRFPATHACRVGITKVIRWSLTITKMSVGGEQDHVIQMI